MGAASLLDEVLAAHGGLERWRAAERVSARVRTGGLLPRTRMPGNRLSDYRVSIDLKAQRTILDPFPGPNRFGVYERGNVRIEAVDGELLESRSEPREAFSGLSGVRRNLRWDPLDTVYFAGYAMWNYLTMPMLLTLPGVDLREGEPWTEPGNDEPWRRLEVVFPREIETHSRAQSFYFDPLGFLRRHDYTAEVIGGWARAAHYTSEHADVAGLVFPTSRRVHPVGRSNRSPGRPTLVSIELSEIEVTAPG